MVADLACAIITIPICIIDNFGVFGIMVIWIGVIDLIFLFIEYLELHEVKSLLD